MLSVFNTQKQKWASLIRSDSGFRKSVLVLEISSAHFVLKSIIGCYHLYDRSKIRGDLLQKLEKHIFKRCILENTVIYLADFVHSSRNLPNIHDDFPDMFFL